MTRAERLRTRFLTTEPPAVQAREKARSVLARARQARKVGQVDRNFVQRAQAELLRAANDVREECALLYARLQKHGPAANDAAFWIEVNAWLVSLCEVGLSADQDAEQYEQWLAVKGEGRLVGEQREVVERQAKQARERANWARERFIDRAWANAVAFNKSKMALVTYGAMRLRGV